MPMTDDRDRTGQEAWRFAEAQHRVRNTLAVVRSLLRRTARSAATVEDLEQHLDARLAAFGRVQAYLAYDPGGSLDLELIVREELLAHAAGTRHVRIEGPEVRLPARVAETFSLAIHELVINAIKFGALTGSAGRIAVAWTLTAGTPAPTLAFSWREQMAGGPLAPPERHGFGFELLDQVMRYELDAEPALVFAPEGLRYTVAFPLSG